MADRATVVKGEFFGCKVTVLVGERCDPQVEMSVRDRLVGLAFNVRVVQCEQWEPLSIYHRGDLISGARVNHFLEYADWLKNH